MLTSLLVVECGYGYFGWCFWLKLPVFVCMLPIRWRQLRAPRNTHSCIIGYNICQSLCSSIKLHLLDPLLFPRYNPVNSPYSEMVFVMKEFTSHYLRYLKGQLKILLSHFSPKIVGWKYALQWLHHIVISCKNIQLQYCRCFLLRLYHHTALLLCFYLHLVINLFLLPIMSYCLVSCRSNFNSGEPVFFSR